MVSVEVLVGPDQGMEDDNGGVRWGKKGFLEITG